MQCSIPCRFIPILPRGLAVLLLLSLLLQSSGLGHDVARPPLPALGSRSNVAQTPAGAVPRWAFRPWILVLAALVHRCRVSSRGGGCSSFCSTPVVGSPTPPGVGVYCSCHWRNDCTVSGCFPAGRPARMGPRVRRGAACLQQLYQLTLVVLVFSSLLQLVCHSCTAPGGLVVPFGLTTWVTRPDDETEIRITTTKANRYTVTLRGAFQLVWEPRDGFENWLLILFAAPVASSRSDPALALTQPQVGEAFGSDQAYVSRWERLVAEHGWHVLSDRFRHRSKVCYPMRPSARRFSTSGCRRSG